MIPRCENDELLISPEDFTGTKWQYYKQLLFLAKNMVKTRTNNSYNQSTIDDDQNYDLFQLFGSSNDMPSLSKAEVETKYDRKSSIALYQQQLQQNHQEQELFKQLQKKLPKLEETSKQKIVDVNQLTDKTITQTQINTIPVVHSKKYYHQQSSSFNHKRRRLDEVTTTNDEKSSNIPSTLEYPTASSINLPNSSNDDDYYFIMSLQPYLHQFSGPQKLKVQMGIQKLVFQELYKHDIDDD